MKTCLSKFWLLIMKFWEKSNRRFAQTTKESGYTVPAFEKIANAYGIKAAAIFSYDELDGYSEWLLDDEPCLINIHLPEATLLIPKIKWETCTIKPDLDKEIQAQVDAVLA